LDYAPNKYVMREELMEIKVIKWDEISTIKALWEGLNAHQHLVSTNFKTFYESFTFEKRIETLKKRKEELEGKIKEQEK